MDGKFSSPYLNTISSSRSGVSKNFLMENTTPYNQAIEDLQKQVQPDFIEAVKQLKTAKTTDDLRNIDALFRNLTIENYYVSNFNQNLNIQFPLSNWWRTFKTSDYYKAIIEDISGDIVEVETKQELKQENQGLGSWLFSKTKQVFTQIVKTAARNPKKTLKVTRDAASSAVYAKAGSEIANFVGLKTNTNRNMMVAAFLSVLFNVSEIQANEMTNEMTKVNDRLQYCIWFSNHLITGIQLQIKSALNKFQRQGFYLVPTKKRSRPEFEDSDPLNAKKQRTEIKSDKLTGIFGNNPKYRDRLINLLKNNIFNFLSYLNDEKQLSPLFKFKREQGRRVNDQKTELKLNDIQLLFENEEMDIFDIFEKMTDNDFNHEVFEEYYWLLLAENSAVALKIQKLNQSLKQYELKFLQNSDLIQATLGDTKRVWKNYLQQQSINDIKIENNFYVNNIDNFIIDDQVYYLPQKWWWSIIKYDLDLVLLLKELVVNPKKFVDHLNDSKEKAKFLESKHDSSKYYLGPHPEDTQILEDLKKANNVKNAVSTLLTKKETQLRSIYDNEETLKKSKEYRRYSLKVKLYAYKWHNTYCFSDRENKYFKHQEFLLFQNLFNILYQQKNQEGHRYVFLTTGSARNREPIVTRSNALSDIHQLYLHSLDNYDGKTEIPTSETSINQLFKDIPPLKSVYAALQPWFYNLNRVQAFRLIRWLGGDCLSFENPKELKGKCRQRFYILQFLILTQNAILFTEKQIKAQRKCIDSTKSYLTLDFLNPGNIKIYDQDAKRAFRHRTYNVKEIFDNIDDFSMFEQYQKFQDQLDTFINNQKLKPLGSSICFHHEKFYLKEFKMQQSQQRKQLLYEEAKNTINMNYETNLTAVDPRLFNAMELNFRNEYYPILPTFVSKYNKFMERKDSKNNLIKACDDADSLMKDERYDMAFLGALRELEIDEKDINFLAFKYQNDNDNIINSFGPNLIALKFKKNNREIVYYGDLWVLDSFINNNNRCTFVIEPYNPEFQEDLTCILDKYGFTLKYFQDLLYSWHWMHIL